MHFISLSKSKGFIRLLQTSTIGQKSTENKGVGIDCLYSENLIFT